MNLTEAVEALKQGELVAFPTETVYGLGADGTNPEALRRLYLVKGRPTDHPVILHLGAKDWLSDYAQPTASSEALVEAFWPGPLTLILPRTERVPDEVCGGQGNVGVRMPSHPLALELLRAFGRPLAAPSANRFGRISPTTADHVRSEFGDSIAGILDGGPCSQGLESTVLDLSGENPTVLRPGGTSSQEIEALLGMRLASPKMSKTQAPGTLKSHYSPLSPCRLTSLEEILRLSTGSVVLARSADPGSKADFWLQAPQSAADYGRELYANLRWLDARKPNSILIEQVPEGQEWEAVRDRLQRASS